MGLGPRSGAALLAIAVVPAIVVWARTLGVIAGGGLPVEDFAVFYTSGRRALEGAFTDL